MARLGDLGRGEEFRLQDGREGTVDVPSRVRVIVEADPVGREMLLHPETQVQRLGSVSPSYSRSEYRKRGRE
jgi:hypothetical protein